MVHDVAEWYEEGREHIWHPYTQMKTTPEPIKVVSTDGVYIILEDGRKLIDGISSWWSCCHGYNHPHIVAKMKEQLDAMPHIMFAGVAHEQAYRLASRLAAITPEGLEKVFFADSGSVAVEVAMKMAVQYHYNRGKKQRTKFIAFRNGYHGDTMGAMSLGDTEYGMHRPFRKYMPGQYVVNIPNDEYSLAEFEDLVASIKSNVAGMIIEPLMQGAGGMRFYSPDILAEIRRIAAKYDIVFIADEIATGFGRTGMMFACNEAGITPDIMCIGKALTGGTCSLAAAIATSEVFEAFLSDELKSAFLHGPTYMATPLACAAANACLDIFEQNDVLRDIDIIEDQMREELQPCKVLHRVTDVRVKGAIGVVELDCEWEDIWYFRRMLLERNVWLRPFSNIIYITPPFSITKEQLSTVTDTVYQILKIWHE